MRSIRPICFPLAMGASLLAVPLGAQSFTTVNGGTYAEDGAGVLATASGYITATRLYDPATRSYRAQLWTFNAAGALQSQSPLNVPGCAFLQGLAGSASARFACGSVIDPDSSAHDMLLIKMDASNNVLWIASPWASGDQELLAVVGLSDGGAVAAGFDNASGSHDALIARFDASGQLMWSTSAGGPLNEEARGIAVSGNDIMVTGREMTYSGTGDCYFARLDMSGNIIWATSWGGANEDSGNALVATAAGEFVMAGTTRSYGTFDQTSDTIPPHVYLIKIDLQGDTVWTRALGDTLFDRAGLALDVVASNGDLLIAGERDSNNAVDALVYRTNSSGQLLWERTYHQDGWDRLLDVRALANGFIASGWTFGHKSRQVLLVRKDPSGN